MAGTAQTRAATDAGMAIARPRKSLLQILFPYLLIAPTLILVVMFTIWPAGQSVISSLYRPPRMATGEPTFVGLQNYIDLFDPTHYIGSNFTQVIINTLIFTFATVLVAVPLALIFALLLNRRIRGLALWRFGLFYPALLPLIGAASIWAFIYSDTVGLLNTILRSFGLSGQNWIGNANLVLGSVIVVNIWKQVGYYMIFYLAGLQGIPRDFYEAAEIEGASTLQQVYYLTLPLLRRTTLFIMIIAFTFGFQTVEQLQVLGGGGPGVRSNMILYYIFQNIQERRNAGYVNAMTVILVLILLVFTVSNFLIFEREEKS
ncbi:MAG: sugar ABC transporter permease [Chloroflexota bacterium]|nr:MAG: sugar ABC transporter permease [Chloroflexota bacterium]